VWSVILILGVLKDGPSPRGLKTEGGVSFKGGEKVHTGKSLVGENSQKKKKHSEKLDPFVNTDEFTV